MRINNEDAASDTPRSASPTTPESSAPGYAGGLPGYGKLPRDEARGSLKMDQSIIHKAIHDDQEATVAMFRQFIPSEERVVIASYLGMHGLWSIGKHCFCCLTERRIASISIGSFGEVIYQDGFIEGVNSGVVYQPSRFGLYIMVTLSFLFALIVRYFLSIPVAGMYMSLGTGGSGGGGGVPAWATFLIWLLCLGFNTLLIPILVRLYYQFNKCGLVFWIKEGISVYVFSNRGRLMQANRIYRAFTEQRDSRITRFGHG